MNPQWQKARIVSLDSPEKQFIGREVWAKIDSIEECVVDHWSPEGKIIRRGRQRVVEVNVFSPHQTDRLCSPPLIALEFLPEFADMVPLLTFSEFEGNAE